MALVGRVGCAALALALVVAADGAPRAQAPTGRSVAEQVRDRHQGKDLQFDVRMTLVDRQGGSRQRDFALKALRLQPREDRTLIRFTRPADINGTGLLVWRHAKGESERFLYLPALGRVRRIAGAEAQEPFVGSDFSYEDIAGQDLDAYDYTLLEADQAAKGAGGEPYRAYALQAKARDARAPFPTIVSLVDRDTSIVRHSEYFDRGGQRRKVLDVGKLARVQDIWTVMEVTMATERDRTRTTIAVQAARYDVGLTEEHLSRTALERGGS